MPDGSCEVVRPGPVTNLDQLYVQAAAAQLMLRRKAQELALRTRGAFAYRPRPAFPSEQGEVQRFVKAADLMENPTTRRLLGIQDCDGPIQWTELKPTLRAMDKILKQHHGEVERLLDVSRETIVFDEVQHILDCLEAIHHDKELVVERVKNALAPDWNADSTAGYRAVFLNLRIESQLAQGLAVDGHVCELLLALKPIQQAISHESHKRYIKLRNYRVLHPLALRPAYTAKRLMSVAAGAVGLSPHSGGPDGLLRHVSNGSTLASASPEHSVRSRLASAMDLRGQNPDGKALVMGSSDRITSNTPIIILKDAHRRSSGVKSGNPLARGGEGEAGSGMGAHDVGHVGRRASNLAQVEEGSEDVKLDVEGMDDPEFKYNDPDRLSQLSFRTATSREGSFTRKSKHRKARSSSGGSPPDHMPGFVWREGEDLPEEVKKWKRTASASTISSQRSLELSRHNSSELSRDSSLNLPAVVAGRHFGVDDRDDEGVVSSGAGLQLPHDARTLLSPPRLDSGSSAAATQLHSRRDSGGAEAAEEAGRGKGGRGRAGKEGQGSPAAGSRQRGSVTSLSSSHSPVSAATGVSTVVSARGVVAAEFVSLSLHSDSHSPCESPPPAPTDGYGVDAERPTKSLPSPFLSRESSSGPLDPQANPPSRLHWRDVKGAVGFDPTADGGPEQIRRLSSPAEEEERASEENASRDSRASPSTEEEAPKVELTRRPDPEVVWSPHGHGQFVLDKSPHRLPPALSPPSPSSAVLEDGVWAHQAGGRQTAMTEIQEVEATIRKMSADGGHAGSMRRVSSASIEASRGLSTSPLASARSLDGAGVSGLQRKGRKQSFGQLRIDVGACGAGGPANLSMGSKKVRSEVRECDEIQEAGDWTAQGEAISKASADSADDQRWVGLTREQFVRRALLPGGHLDSRRENIDTAIADVKYFSVFETSYPIAAALSKPGFRVAIACTAFIYFGYVIYEATALARSGRITDTKQIRFKPVDEHHRRHGPGDWVRKMEFFSNGCPIHLPAGDDNATRTSSSEDESVVTILETTEEFLLIPKDPLDFDGLLVITNASGQDEQASGFTLEAVQGEHVNPGHDGRNWRTIGGQEAYMKLNGLSFWTPSADRDWFAEREGLWSISVRNGLRYAQVSLAPPWYAWLGLFSLTVGMCGCAMVLSLLAVAGKAAWGKRVVVGMLLSVSLCLALNASFSLADAAERRSSAVLQCLNVVALVIIAVGLMLREQAALGLWLYASVHFAVMHALEDAVLYPTPWQRYWLDMPIMSYLFFGVGVVFFALRQRLLVNSARDIAMDMQGYRVAWRDLLDQEQEVAGLKQIDEVRTRAVCCAVVAEADAWGTQVMKEWSYTNSHPNWPVLQRCRAELKPTMLERVDSMGAQSVSMSSKLWGLMSTGLASPFVAGAGERAGDEYWLSVRPTPAQGSGRDESPHSPGSSAVLSRGQSSAASSSRTFGSSAPLLAAVEKRRQSMETHSKAKRDRRGWEQKRSSLGAPPSWATFNAKSLRALREDGLEGRLARDSAGARRSLEGRSPLGREDGSRLPPRGQLGVRDRSSGLDPFTEEGSQIGWSSEEGGSLGGRSPESDPGKGRMFNNARSSMGSIEAASDASSRPRLSQEGEGCGHASGEGGLQRAMRRSASEGNLSDLEVQETPSAEARGSVRLEERLESLAEGEEREDGSRPSPCRPQGEGVDMGIVRTKSGGRPGETPQQRWRRKWLPRSGTIKSFKSSVKGASFRQFRKLQSLYEWVGTFSSHGSSNSQDTNSGSGTGDGAKKQASRKSSWSERRSRSRTSSASLDVMTMLSVQVTSLEQTYVQAAGVYSMLKEKVRVWGSDKGFFRVQKQYVEQEGALYLPWRLVDEDEGKRLLVEWAGLKRATRAVEKLVRSYGNRVCKLLDICRQSIVFESTQDIAACLKQIASDDDVSILSIKNRLSQGYDDKETVGYRDVNINLRFKNEDAHRLGLEFHICEVQLLLRSFAELKSDRGHARYVKFRNARAL